MLHSKVIPKKKVLGGLFKKKMFVPLFEGLYECFFDFRVFGTIYVQYEAQNSKLSFYDFTALQTSD